MPGFFISAHIAAGTVAALCLMRARLRGLSGVHSFDPWRASMSGSRDIQESNVPLSAIRHSAQIERSDSC